MVPIIIIVRYSLTDSVLNIHLYGCGWVFYMLLLNHIIYYENEVLRKTKQKKNKTIILFYVPAGLLFPKY